VPLIVWWKLYSRRASVSEVGLASNGAVYLTLATGKGLAVWI